MFDEQFMIGAAGNPLAMGNALSGTATPELSTPEKLAVYE